MSRYQGKLDFELPPVGLRLTFFPLPSLSLSTLLLLLLFNAFLLPAINATIVPFIFAFLLLFLSLCHTFFSLISLVSSITNQASFPACWGPILLLKHNTHQPYHPPLLFCSLKSSHIHTLSLSLCIFPFKISFLSGIPLHF